MMMSILTPHLQNIICQRPSCANASFVPVILGSDKTTVSVATGQNKYYPLYCSIGNVHNNIRRAHRNASGNPLPGHRSLPGYIVHCSGIVQYSTGATPIVLYCTI